MIIVALHVVLVEPEIPPNTGNIARSCAATGTVLHLVEPLGFLIDDKALKRAGLDYWPYVDLRVHQSLDEFMKEMKGKSLYFITTKGEKLYTEVSYKDEDVLIFGKETKGLPKELINDNKDRALRIPMSPDTRSRSFNLSNAANIVLFEALRQLNFPDMT